MRVLFLKGNILIFILIVVIVYASIYYVLHTEIDSKSSFLESTTPKKIKHLFKPVKKPIFRGETEKYAVKNGGELPWFFKEGKILPKPGEIKAEHLRPREGLFRDRIIEQLMFVPSTSTEFVKTIHFRYGNALNENFNFNICPVTDCALTDSFTEADAVIFRDNIREPRPSQTKSQIWILFCLENPKASCSSLVPSAVNWTASYRSDSDVVTPYGKWVYYNENVQSMTVSKDYLTNKHKEVAWFVSNCNAWNKRKAYAQELSKYIDVDIYGKCGNKKCPRSSNEKCLELLKKDYKFYLAFENNNCRDYITEKFFSNALENDVIPIVMGAHPDDYAAVAPFQSYIHVDSFPSPKDLADYLHLVGSDPELYNAYFMWKNTGEFINTRFLCRVCAMLHSNYSAKYYKDVNEWINGKSICRTDSWVV